MKKINKIFIFLFFLSALIGVAGAVHAIEATYLQIPGLPDINIEENQTLPKVVVYWFGFGMYIAGIMAVISFAIGAVQFSMSISPELHKNGKDRMIGAIIGLLLTVSSVIILNTINSDLVSPSITALPATGGIYYSNGDELRSAPTSENYALTNIQQGYTKLRYICDSGPAIWIWRWKEIGFNGDTDTTRLECGQEVTIESSGSFKWEYENNGIYYCNGDCGNGSVCEGLMSGVKNSANESLPDEFKGKIKGVIIVNDTTNGTYYGAIFHKELSVESGGQCTEPIISTQKISCQTVSISASSVNIFSWNKDTPTTSGSGITFYEKSFGWNANVQAGNVKIYNKDLGAGGQIYKKEAEKIIFNYTGIESDIARQCNSYPKISCKESYDKDSDNYKAVQAGQCCPCLTFKDCPGSIRIEKNDLVSIYSEGKDESNNTINYCKTYTKDVETVQGADYVQPGQKLKYIEIIPIQ